MFCHDVLTVGKFHDTKIVHLIAFHGLKYIFFAQVSDQTINKIILTSIGNGSRGYRYLYFT